MRVSRPGERPGIAALRIGFRSARVNVVPMVVLWALAAGTVWAYYSVPAVAAAFEPLRKWQMESGWLAAFLNRVFFNGLLPGVFLLAIPSIRPKHVLLVIGAQALWGGCWGVVTDFFFRWLDVLFGPGRDMATLFSKMMADEFGLTLFLTAPADAAFFFWVGRDFSIARAWRERPRQFFFGLVLPNLISNWCVWVPVSLAIFAFPLPLQVQISGFAAAFWTLMCLQIGARTMSCPMTRGASRRLCMARAEHAKCR